MPVTFHLEHDVIVFETREDIQFREGTDVLREAFAAASAKNPNKRWHLLFDIRQSRENRSSDELQSVAALIAEQRNMLSFRCAVVASDLFHFALARMFSSFLESLGLQGYVCREIDEARAWLRSTLIDS